ncbi:MAG: AarF/UbiB family protein [Desulfobacteraceae bacterium]|jgi:ubiquinone biosynthesis protein
MNLKTLTGIGRFKDIVMILMKYGFDDLVDRLDIPGIGLFRKVHRMNHDLETFERIRRALEELGPSFVKFGQIMSLRPDLLPHALIDELSKLQDDVAPVEFSLIKEIVEKNTMKSLHETFSIFDPEPLAAASISQVHRGVLKQDGRIAAIKVQRPDIRSNIRTDLDILAAIADQLHERVDYLKTYDLPNLIRVTRLNLLRELDFKREARNMKIAASYLGEHPETLIPEVYEEYCTEHLLVMEYIQGTKLKDLKSEALADPETTAGQGLRAAIKQILDDGFFHADPHPGNMLITPDERICLVDWGLTGRLSKRDRNELIDLMKSVADRDSEAMVLAILRICRAEGAVDQRSLDRDLLDVLDSYYAIPIKEMNIGQLLMAIVEFLRKYNLRLHADLVIMIKALVTAEGTARLIYPDLDVLSEAKDYISRLALERFRPESLLRGLRYSLSRFFSMQKEIPGRILQFLDRANRGEFTLGFRHENLGGLMNTLESITNRLTLGIIIAAMIIGSSMVITTGIGPFLFGFPVLGLIGYLVSGFLGLWLILTIIRGRKH